LRSERHLILALSTACIAARAPSAQSAYLCWLSAVLLDAERARVPTCVATGSGSDEKRRGGSAEFRSAMAALHSERGRAST